MLIKKVLKSSKIALGSKALDVLIEKTFAAERGQAIDAAYKVYYDNATEAELKEDTEWAELSLPSLGEVPR